MIRPRKFRTHEARRRERVRVGLRVGALMFGVLLLLVGISYAVRQPFARIGNIDFAIAGTLNRDQLTSVATASLAGKHLWLFPRDSLLIPHRTHVEQVLRDTFPRIKDVSVSREGRTLHADVVERTPDALWCGDVVPLIPVSGGSENPTSRGRGMCFLVDATGFIYDRAPEYSDDAFLRYYGSLERAQPIGQYMVDTEEFQAWQAFVSEITPLVGMLYAILMVDERDVELYGADGARIIVPRQVDKQVLRERLEALVHSGEIDTARSVEYVDLRFGAKVFVKYREAGT